ncbi:MAG: hypothetical protein KAR39_12395 [Thermoplasmata archaeon]|nr:hypothetical protein [Thermoplasmata archaeon]
MASFAFARTGTGGTAADTLKQVGADIIMPAGGPYTIYGVYGQLARVTQIPDESTGGYLKLDALSGDLTPDPAPGKFPIIGSPAAASANSHISAVPLNIWPTNFQASGKASIALSYANDEAITTAPVVIAGILFGTEIPTKQPHIFMDSVQAEFASAAEQTLGSIILAEKASRITGVMAVLNKPGATTVAEPIAATIRLDSADVKIQPSQYPCNQVFNSADGTLEGAPSIGMAQMIPVDIPVIAGSTINVYATTTQSVTGNASVRVFLAYE